MSEESTKAAGGDADAGAGTQTLPTEVELKVRGKTLTVPLEKALILAQQGMVQQQNAERLAVEKAAFEAKATRYAEYERFTGHLEGHPDVAKAVELAINDPQRVLNPSPQRQKQEVDDDLYGEEKQTRDNGADQATRNDILALRQEIAALKEKESVRDAAESAGARSGTIDREISDYPWLKAPKMAALAKAQIASTLAANPEAGLAQVTAEVAGQFREAFEAEQTAKVETARNKSRLRTEKPTRGTPIPGMKKAPTKEDLAGGKLLAPLKQMARDWGYTVD
jgi:hypothetical protein